jgi:hypothetical protein
MTAMFTTAMAQETVDFSAGTFGGVNGDKSTYSQWTSAEGITIVSTDATFNEIGAMKYYNNRFQLDITEAVAQPALIGIKYTITVPEGYTLVEMKVKNSSSSDKNDMSIDYNNRYNSISLLGTTAEKTIPFDAGRNSFYLRGPVGKCIYITSLTITKPTSINEIATETEEVIYDLTGRRIDEITEAGIYIVNGKKTLIK